MVIRFSYCHKTPASYDRFILGLKLLILREVYIDV
jgi:hypothetical protein